MVTHPDRTLGFVLHDVARMLRKRFDQRARGLGLTRAQWHALAHLAQHEGTQQGCLADVLELEPITLGRTLDKLEAAGLVERRAHPKDRRIWLLYLRPAAHPVLEQMRRIGDATRADALAGLGDDDQERLMQILRTMKGNLIEACNSPEETRAVSHG